jgi:hypothetical protein
MAFALIGIAAVVIFVNLRTGLFLLAFLGTTSSATYFFMNIHLSITNKGKDRPIIKMFVSLLSLLLIGGILYFFYDLYSFLKAISMSVVITVIIFAYVKIMNR